MSIDIDKTITEYNELRLIIIEEQKRVQQEVLPLLEAAKKEYDDKNWFMKWWDGSTPLNDILQMLLNAVLICPPVYFWHKTSFMDGYNWLSNVCKYNVEDALPIADKNDPNLNSMKLEYIVAWAKVYSRFVINKGI